MTFRSYSGKITGSFLTIKKEQLSSAERTIRHLDPANILKRGYSMTYLHGRIIKDARELNAGDTLITRYFKGSSKSMVINEHGEKGSDPYQVKTKNAT